MPQTLGIDLGTGSIGLAVRDNDLGRNVVDQLQFYSVTTFKRGVGKGKTGEYSFAAERTKYRSTRRLYQARKYRIWQTLDVLIRHDCCPLTLDGLDLWRKYDKTRGLKRSYPIDQEFENWVRLDFNGDGVADYSSPYQLRKELATIQFNLENQIERYKLGRSIYHIAQRRGFKSSKNDKGGVDESNEKVDTDSIEFSDVSHLKQSEQLKSGSLEEYRSLNHLPTVGCAFAKLEHEGIRVRDSIYQAVRSQYEAELKYIFNFQKDVQPDSDFYNEVINAIFYKRPLRSQKGLVGKCTLEPNKTRCKLNHPEFEFFRAWSFINNIRYEINKGQKLELDLAQKRELYKSKYLRVKKSFKFEEIREWIEKHVGKPIQANYKDNVIVPGCPISARFNNIFGEKWERIEVFSTKSSEDLKGKVYKFDDIWHICSSYTDEENIVEFATNINLDEKATKALINLWAAMPEGYSMLSYKAIKNINKFLAKGLIYTESVLMAKIPEVITPEEWNLYEKDIIENTRKIIDRNKESKLIINIVNKLISNYKSLQFQDQYAYKTNNVTFDSVDKSEIVSETIATFGEITWSELEETERDYFLNEITRKFEAYFHSSAREYLKLPPLANELKKYLSSLIPSLKCVNDNYSDCNCKACTKLKKLYHPSQIEYYSPSKLQSIIWKGKPLSLRQLGNPDIGVFKNPVALRTLHILRRNINYLLKEGIINEETRVVVELARDLNDANMRWAIETYQKERENENKEFEKILDSLPSYKTMQPSDDAIDKVRLALEQNESFNETYFQIKNPIYKKDITKYRLWLEQGCKCIYTGKTINLSDLFNENNLVDFEHTIPRSISFDNSLSNLTVCYQNYNRSIKKNRIPYQLENYEKDCIINGKAYSAILPRIQPWIKRLDKIESNMHFWQGKSKLGQDKQSKDFAIRQANLWKLEFDYWKGKVERFKMKEVKSGFLNSQLVDTRIISKYAFHYLKSVFQRVEVQKGNVTADFRMILGIQDEFSKKDRQKHSHHAIDATVLTLIPSAAKRDKMLRLYYQIYEQKNDPQANKEYQEQLRTELLTCNMGSVKGLVSEIENNILINKLTVDRTLNKGERIARRKGKPVYDLDKNGNKKVRLLKGDSIRGQLHQESFIGAIKQPLKDDNGKILRSTEGDILTQDKITFVKRELLKYRKSNETTGFANWEELELKIVDKELYKMIRNQYPDTTFESACQLGLYMIDSDGRKVNKIRHIRCFSEIKNPLSIKKQTYVSAKQYKQFYYAGMGELYALCRYSDELITKSEFRILSLFDVSENRKSGLPDIPETIISKKNEELTLNQIIKPGHRLILYSRFPEEVTELEKEKLLNRIYVIRGFENDGCRVVMVKHNIALDDKILGKGAAVKNLDDLPFKIRCGINTLHYLHEGTDFSITAGGELQFK